jgi:hypothetical protein
MIAAASGKASGAMYQFLSFMTAQKCEYGTSKKRTRKTTAVFCHGAPSLSGFAFA